MTFLLFLRRKYKNLVGNIELLFLAIALQVPVVTMVSGAMTVLLTTGLTVVAATRAITRRLILP